MSMKSLEDLERAFDRGLTAMESGIVLKAAGRMGQKCIREIKYKTPVITGNLRRNWYSKAEMQDKDVIIQLRNGADYAEPVNNGHRIVVNGETVGKKPGRRMLEKGMAAYKDRYMADDMQGIIEELKTAMKG